MNGDDEVTVRMRSCSVDGFQFESESASAAAAIAYSTNEAIADRV
jgi:hypothetical protein